MSFHSTTSSSTFNANYFSTIHTTTNNSSIAASTVAEALLLHTGNSGLLGESGSACGGVSVQPFCSSSRSSSGNFSCSSSSSSSSSVAGGVSASSMLFDSGSGLFKHDCSGLATDWSVDEQYKLEEGLAKFAYEPSILRYVKIAATLPDKTVRDVALRCRWMTRKRRKGEEFNAGKKVNNRKDKMPEPSSKMNLPSMISQNMAACSSVMRYMDHGSHFPFEGISGTSRHLSEQNFQTFSQITANLNTFKLQDNIDLFCHARNNITAILDDMRVMPGIMSQMPPLPVSINEDLANSILPITTQVGLYDFLNDKRCCFLDNGAFTLVVSCILLSLVLGVWLAPYDPIEAGAKVLMQDF